MTETNVKVEPADLWTISTNPKKAMIFSSTKFVFRSITDLNQLIKSKLHTVSEHYDLVVGIPRSGLLAANIIALHLNAPLLSLGEITNISSNKLFTSRRKPPMNRWQSGNPIRILVVDDSSNSGASIGRAKQLIAGQPHLAQATIKYLAIYATKDAVKFVDLHFELLEQPRIFEWNFMHHDHAQNFLFDLDGVLCEDGPPESADNLERYLDHLENARPKILPSLPIGAIVTSRLEKYRSQTELWLKKHHISYRHLIMTNLQTAEERRKLSLHGKFKADVYKTLGGSLFIESETWQAEQIASITKKAVYNLQESRFLAPQS